jgi:hypothetical protein
MHMLVRNKGKKKHPNGPQDVLCYLSKLRGFVKKKQSTVAHVAGLGLMLNTLLYSTTMMH